MKALFILGVDQDDRPERWASKHHVYSCLATGLARLGVDHHLYANRASVKPEYLVNGHYSYADSHALDDVLARSVFTHAFIWGGRTPADRRIVQVLRQRDIRCIFGESGWFPQSGHCYFSEHGTNAECQLAAEGLPAHHIDENAFRRVRGGIARDLVGFWGSLSLPPMTGPATFDVSRPILMPLQDEGDTNITLSSPISRMSDFVRLFAERYPQQRFIARPHPRSPLKLDLGLANVELQDPSVNLYRCWRNYGGVIGVNSTTLLQFSLLGLPVCGIGKGIGTGHHAYYDLDIAMLPDDLGQLSVDRDRARHFYDFLIRKKQLVSRKLADARYLRASYVPAYFGLT